MDSLEEGSDWFGWVHLSFPLVGQIKQQYYSPAAQGQDPSMLRPPADEKEDAEDDDENVVQADDVPSYEDALSTFDEQLGRMLDLVEARADGSDTWILLAGTMGDQRRDESNVLPGLGYSLDRRVVDVPVIVRSPADGASLRSSDEAVWAPDVAATIASVAGVELPARAEGVSLTEPAPDRISFSWSWALLDQMGWRALASARAGDRELIVGEPLAPVAEGVAVDDLREALAARANPARAGLPGEITAPLLAHFEIEPEPIPEEGRDYDDETLRKRVAGRSWVARARYLQANWMSGGQTFTTIRARWDAQNYIAHLDRGHMMALRGLPQKELITKGAVQLRPDDPEAWHWFAHAHWGETGEDAERIISKIQPYLANQADALYDLACTRSLAGDLEVSAEFLERAYRAGFRDRPHILADPDLRNLRQSEFFSEVMQRLH
ncbi:MAG: hypothetical protein GTO30_18300 [Acidobacteria bacterium]|nr:hypothetical protein [Acidobacteriota bacterium]NIQ84145.1 hypothetical protein [Acidobacteriota bacterium]